MKIFFSDHFLQFFRFLKLKLMRQDVIIRGKCNQCGSCCKNLSIINKGRWIYTEEQFKDIIKEIPEYSRLKIVNQNSDGTLLFTCMWLQEDGKCQDYVNRLDICKNYPDTQLYYMRSTLSEVCGYSIEAGVKFEKILKKALKKHRSKPTGL